MLRPFLCILLFAIAALAAELGDGFLGRWDLTVTSASGQYPSWLEVSRSEGKLAARFVGRGGSVRPAEVRIEDEELHFAPGRPRYAKEETQKESYRARLAAGKLEGAGFDNQGNAIRWVGVRVVRPATRTQPRWAEPVTLFNGRNIEGWDFKNPRGKECWSVVDGVLVNKPPCPNIFSARQFRDFKLHVEFNLDPESNSGVYLRGRYEVQINDDRGRQLGSHGMAGIYGFLAPALDASRKPGEWQTFEVTLAGYHVTVVFNGRTIIDNQEIDGITGGALDSDETTPGPIMLQGDHGRVRFRNITVTPGN